jgi:photosystem II stability/assembly factor-like uncharacterized protein
VWVFRSGDAGTTFSPVAPVPATSVEGMSAAPGSPQVLLALTPGAILRSTDGGTAWATVYRTVGTGPGYVGFTTSGQAFALHGTTMVMSRDGGATWSPVTF